MPNIYAPPLPNRAAPRPVPSSQVDADGVPNEPPPAYSAAPGASTHEQSIAQGPQYMDFNGPPPSNHQHIPPSIGSHPGQAGPSNSWAGPSTSQWQPGPAPPSSIPSRPGPSSAASIPAPAGNGPTEIPTPGRPLLKDGKVLIYPKGFFCSKCYNTGFKSDDPYHPCKTCWKKHSKPYTQAMSYSWPTNTNDTIDTTTGSNNYQRPMTLSQHQNQVGGQPGHTAPQKPVMNDSAFRPGMIASGGQTNRLPSGYFPGHPIGPGPPPMPSRPSHSGYPGGGGEGGPPQAMYVSHGGGGGWGWGGTRAPPGALVVQPGDPRLGGMPCYKCGGTGETVSFFGFENDHCRACQGVGRVY